MNKNLTVYPISNGRQLNIYCNYNIQKIYIKSLNGTQLYSSDDKGKELCINIEHLQRATYILEVEFDNTTKTRSVFVKT